MRLKIGRICEWGGGYGRVGHLEGRRRARARLNEAARAADATRG